MTDSEHLAWVIGRLINVHGENPNVDYMLRLQEIAQKIDLPVAKINRKENESDKAWRQLTEDSEYLADVADLLLGKQKSDFENAINKVKELEWPSIGDDVVWNNCKCRVLLRADKGGHIVAVDDNGYYVNPHIDSVDRPKNEDDVLRKDLIKLCCSSAITMNDVIELFLRKYTVKPK